mmetsp:Transcript_1462/g.2015  ORF Transcript_1462/g.2015 Transcript_1462/m.2015 type:complete len:117 (-) Transcript_1462:334-684(-)|eukprot:CAMPEP_0198143448 /NCGR_PEP_ID=MMETSP1443-20131203/7604_1 /TAXON_ID=186043 /ORGANISM="Entomoneis sp., Strain CCMP2396" /LENGTH=116 /DNA_ID=CAMNT_0043806685 /DNA_START=46 /DNA_END=396 /DNA_ORIENTATION=-
MFRTKALLMSKRITLPRLSPTHTKSRILKWEVAAGAEVVSYDPVFVVECSSDFITEAYRQYPDERLRMMIDTQEEGTLKGLVADTGDWMDVGTPLGVVDDGDPIDGEWTWQANKYD